MPKIINFYGSREPYFEFSNFARFRVTLGGKTWPTSEHYFQAQKFLDESLQEEVRLAKTPRIAADLGRDRSEGGVALPIGTATSGRFAEANGPGGYRAAGSSLAIVGPTGSGKTTLVSLIPRIYDAAPGTVLIDGRPIRDYTLASLRRNIGFVPQETFLFSDRIRENIALGVDSATDQQIHDAADAANIATDIEGFPEGYETMVGERGITLSGGQKQRAAIARALIRNPKILILDDALSSVDTHTEDKILNHLRDVMHGRTTIFISHRVSTVRNADRIAVLHGGRIVEIGTHDELLALNGYYSDLYSKQLLEEELAEV